MKNLNRNLALLFLALNTLLSLPANAGNWTGAGNSEFTTTERNPWFLGKERVTYCIEKSSDFSAPLELARTEITQAIQDWVRTLNLFRMSARLPVGQGTDSSPYLDLDDISLEYQERAPSANGRCPVSTDLVFYLGDTPPSSPQDTSSDHSLIATSARVRPNGAGSESAGFIWLSPDRNGAGFRSPQRKLGGYWGNPTVLYNVLLHEMGHVFGFPHQKNTVMDPEFASYVIQAWDANFPASTEATRILFPLRRGSSLQYYHNNLVLHDGPDQLCGRVATPIPSSLKEILGIGESQEPLEACIQVTRKVSPTSRKNARLSIDLKSGSGNRKPVILSLGFSEQDGGDASDCEWLQVYQKGDPEYLSLGGSAWIQHKLLPLQRKRRMRGSLELISALVAPGRTFAATLYYLEQEDQRFSALHFGNTMTLGFVVNDAFVDLKITGLK